MKLLIGALLIIHGLISWPIFRQLQTPTGGLQNPSWLSWWPTNLGQSWLLSVLGLERITPSTQLSCCSTWLAAWPSWRPG